MAELTTAEKTALANSLKELSKRIKIVGPRPSRNERIVARKGAVASHQRIQEIHKEVLKETGVSNE